MPDEYMIPNLVQGVEGRIFTAFRKSCGQPFTGDYITFNASTSNGKWSMTQVTGLHWDNPHSLIVTARGIGFKPRQAVVQEEVWIELDLRAEQRNGVIHVTARV